jgi:hypothetical protein
VAVFPADLKPFLSHLLNVFSYNTVFNSIFEEKGNDVKLDLLKKLEWRHCEGGNRNALARIG